MELRLHLGGGSVCEGELERCHSFTPSAILQQCEEAEVQNAHGDGLEGLHAVEIGRGEVVVEIVHLVNCDGQDCGVDDIVLEAHAFSNGKDLLHDGEEGEASGHKHGDEYSSGERAGGDADNAGGIEVDLLREVSIMTMIIPEEAERTMAGGIWLECLFLTLRWG